MAPRSGSRSLPTGCLTCRIRKVKCDEDKPACSRCTSTGRRCDGYSDIPFSRDELKAASQRSSLNAHTNGTCSAPAELVQTLISDVTFINAAEKRYFQFFRQCTVKDTNLVIDSRFWDRIVLQASHAEPAVKHAVLALGSYHSFTMRKNDDDAARQHLQYADQQYLRALCEAKTLVATASFQQTERVLMVCVLFIIFEGMRGNYAASQAHMDNARAISAQHRKNTRDSTARSRLNEVSGVMARLDVLALNFSDMTAPYRYTLKDFLATTPTLMPAHFNDVQQASASLVDILRWMLVLDFDLLVGDNTGDLVRLDRLRAQLDVCGDRLYVWRQHWDDLMSRLGSSSRTPPALNTECWYTIAEIFLDVGLARPEKKYDASLHRFRRIVDLGEHIASDIATGTGAASFSVDLGFVVPMFLTAIRCRDPYVRRRAIEVLEYHERQEGMWASKPAAAIAMRWTEFEERGLANVEAAEDVPEDNRVCMSHVEVDTQRSTARLRFQTLGRGQTYQLSPVQEVRWSGQPPA